MIVHPLDFKINRDLVYLKLGLLSTPIIRSTANMRVSVEIIHTQDHEEEETSESI